MHDLIIVGGGPAAIVAAIYAARHRVNTLLIAPSLGGQVADSWLVENYLGYKSISGVDLAERFEEHLDSYQVERRQDTVEAVSKENGSFIVRTGQSQEFPGKATIIASGRSPRRLDIPGEREFDQRGITYCSTCDGPLFADMDVAVIGGGDAALLAAAQLVSLARKVYVVSRREWRAEVAVQEKVRGAPNLQALVGYIPVEIFGRGQVEGLRIQSSYSNRIEELALSGIFVEIGSIPNSDMVKGLAERNDKGEILVDRMGRTSVPGLFAAGDVTDMPFKQIIIAAGEGAKVFLSAWEYLLRQK
ncbi:MAG: FAD-dependent oxidoreductase [Chloroflexi bacterium]|nr:FAD-dependent oxidoreductase [Chloroflexota bacterium]